MKSAILLALSSALLLASVGTVPRKAPALIIKTAAGKSIPLTRYAGKTVILAFVLTDCDHCQATTKLLNGIQRDYAARGVQVLETAVDVMASMRVADFQKKFGTIFPVGFNTQDDCAKFLGYPPGVRMVMPGVVFIDRTGTIRAQFDGNDDELVGKDQSKSLRAVLDKTIKQGQPEKKTVE